MPISSTRSSQQFINTFDVVTLSSDRVAAYWKYKDPRLIQFIKHLQIFYAGEGKSEFQRAPKIFNASKTSLEIGSLEPNQRYRVCLQVASKSGKLADDYVCGDASTQFLSLGAIIGCLIGAVLALSIIIFLVVLYQKTIGRSSSRGSRCTRDNPDGGGYSSKRGRIDSAFESQFDSIAIREEMSMYDETSTVDASSFISTPPTARNQRFISQPKGILTNNSTNNGKRNSFPNDSGNSTQIETSSKQDEEESSSKQHLLNKNKSSSTSSSFSNKKSSTRISKLPTCVSEDETTCSLVKDCVDDDQKNISPKTNSDSECINNNITEKI